MDDFWPDGFTNTFLKACVCPIPDILVTMLHCQIASSTSDRRQYKYDPENPESDNEAETEKRYG